jgi:SAM-dependent methyltransferase
MGPQFFVENFISMYDYVRVTGGFVVPGRRITGLTASQNGCVLATGRVNLPAPGHPVACRFEISFTTPKLDYKELRLSFEFEGGGHADITGAEAAEYYLSAEKAGNRAEKTFFQRIADASFPRVLEVGSRARSGITRRHLFAGKQYTGLDILQGPNVDVVGDAHTLSEHVPTEGFDAVFSTSTFEHLAMPWKVAIELNKVLRTGGLAYIVTHQALGMHDLPWDFWRFSDSAWNALFNQYTGFRVVETFLGGPMLLVPHIFWDHWLGYEGAAGFSTSAVLIEKTGPTNMAWDVNVMEAIRGMYPA